MNTTVAPIRQRAMTGALKLYAFSHVVLSLFVRYTARILLAEASPRRYVEMMRRLVALLGVLRHNKVMRIGGEYKLQIYLPAFPSPAFFHALQKYDPATREPGPLSVVLSMTKACGYKCPHCYQRFDQGREVEVETLAKVIRQMQDAGVATFDIEGGEPMLRFDRLCAVLAAFDERAEIWVNTTGHMLTREKAERMRRLGVFGVYVSIHSADAATHDTFTGFPGAFDIACRAIRTLHDAGIATAINYCASPEDLAGDGARRLFALGRSLGCAFIQVIHGKAAGGWLQGGHGVDGDASHVDAARALHVQYNQGRSFRDFPALAVQVFEESPAQFGCTAGGVDRFYLNHEGEVQPCEFLNVSFGNVNTEPFTEIFRRMRSCFTTPGESWLCCTEAPGIAAAVQGQRPLKTPLPRDPTVELVRSWDKGRETALYRRLRVYRAEETR